MSKFQIICLLVLVLPFISLAIILVQLIKQRDNRQWTRCWNCGIYFDSWGDTTKLPMDGMVRKEFGLCKSCLHNEKQVDGYAKRRN